MINRRLYETITARSVVKFEKLLATVALAKCCRMLNVSQIVAVYHADPLGVTAVMDFGVLMERHDTDNDLVELYFKDTFVTHWVQQNI